MRTLFALLTATTVAVACTNQPAPTSAGAGPAAQISDGAHSSGNAHFFFLPPMVANPGANGSPDATLSPVVDICAWNGSACGASLAHFTTDLGTTTTTQPGNSETVRGGEAHYIVNWHTGNFGLNPDQTYRICVSVNGQGMGHADVDVVESGRDLKNVDTDQFIALLNGRTLPIKFRIEEGALDDPAASPCGGGDPV